MNNVVLAVLAHPDDAEFLCAGTLIRLRQEHGWEVHIATMTPGDCGSATLPPVEIAQIRRDEGYKAAKLMGATYHCLEERDLLVHYSPEALEKVTTLLCEVKPRIVITHTPGDYHMDHEMTSTLARAATFAAPVPNFMHGKRKPPALEHIPYLYYCDPLDEKDISGRAVEPGFVIDVSTVFELKTTMLTTHASQREWLMSHHGLDHYVEALKRAGKRRGEPYSVAYAEGFRQHLGHSYPQDNLIGDTLRILQKI